MRILVVGGAGYVGSALVLKLLEEGYKVRVLDLYLYGRVFEKNENLEEVVGDVRNKELVDQVTKDCDAVIHLACISNDPSFELNPELGKSINFDSFEPFVQLAKKNKVKRFIYASSSSVYGIKQEKDVHEKMDLEPLTDYSKYKALCEEVLLKYVDDSFICTILRPSTVCGYSLRQRLDLVVNILTNLAYNTGKIKVMGGDQMRPNIHINDMVRAYLHVLKEDKEKIQGEIFNVGYDNFAVLDLGKMVQKVLKKKDKNVDIEIVPTNDNRSYHVSSKKILEKLKFFAKNSVEEGIEDLVEAFENNKLPNSLTDKRYFNIAMMKEENLT